MTNATGNRPGGTRADASVAAGSVGRSAEAATDLHLRAEIPSHSRSRGVCAGLALDGAVNKPDQDQRIPPAARKLVDTLHAPAPARA